jgi:hypothetical protein
MTSPDDLNSSDDWRKAVRRNKLLRMWAAEKLGITGRDAEAYFGRPRRRHARPRAQ